MYIKRYVQSFRPLSCLPAASALPLSRRQLSAKPGKSLTSLSALRALTSVTSVLILFPLQPQLTETLHHARVAMRLRLRHATAPCQGQFHEKAHRFSGVFADPRYTQSSFAISSTLCGTSHRNSRRLSD